MQPDRIVLREAAEWLATLQSGDAREEDYAGCRRWREQDARHEQAYRKVESLWQRFDGLNEEDAAATTVNAVLAGERRRHRLRNSGVLAVLFTALVGLGTFTDTLPGRHMLADYHSGVGELRRIDLPDGSELLLNTDSAVDLAYSDGERRVHLRQGELWVDVSPDANRPFVVDTESGTARALGTSYAVRTEDNAGMQVVVTESRVEVCAGAASRQCVQTVAGQSARIGDGALSGPQAIDALTATAWTRRRLAVDNQPLAEVLAELNRYRRGYLHYDAAALAGVSVSGVFSLDDTDRALDTLAAYLPIRVQRVSPWFVSVRRADTGDVITSQ